MLVSHSHQFILVKTKKTAGSSIQSFLRPYCKAGIVEEYFGSHRESESIIDLVGEEVWNTYTKICPVRNPWDLMVSWYYWERRDLSLFQKTQRILQGKNAVSTAKKLSFDDYIKHREEINKVNINRKKMIVNNEWPNYFFIRYEFLLEDVKTLCELINVPFDESKFPHKKGGFRDGKNYQEFYNEKARQIIARAYAKEIKKFGYEF